MAPSKRKENTTANQRTAKVAKQTKAAVEAPSKPAVVVVQEEHKPIVAMLDQAVQLACVSPGSREMMQNTLSTLFVKGKEGRHGFQARIIELFDTVLGDTQAKLEKILSDVKSKIGAAEAAGQAAVEKSESLKQRMAANNDEVQASAAALKEAAACVVDGQQSLDTLVAKESSAKLDRTASAATKDTFHELLHEQWEALCTWDATGRHWKARKKEVADVMSLFAQIDGFETSLQEGLEVALQTKASSRGNFAAKVLEHSKRALEEHFRMLTAQLATHDAEMQAAVEAVSSAQARLEAATEHRQVCKQNLAEVTSKAVSMEQELTEAASSEQQSKSAIEELQKELPTRERDLEQFSSWFTQYLKLKSAADSEQAGLQSASAEAVAAAEQSHEAQEAEVGA